MKEDGQATNTSSWEICLTLTDSWLAHIERVTPVNTSEHQPPKGIQIETEAKENLLPARELEKSNLWNF